MSIVCNTLLCNYNHGKESTNQVKRTGMNDGLRERGTVLKAAGAAGLLLATNTYGATARKCYAVVGVGSRVRMYTNAGRMGLAVKKIAATGAW